MTAPRSTRPPARLTPWSASARPPLMAAVPGPDLAAVGYVEEELGAAGTARAYAADGGLGPHPDAAYRTRVVVRRPADGAPWSGTLVVEWLNVSSGQDAAPDWTYTGAEIVRRGHAWAGVSAQHVGVEGGAAAVAAGSGLPGLQGLRQLDPERYGGLHHPGDAYCYDIYTQVAAAVADRLGATCVLAMGESQSAYALTTYAEVVQHDAGLFAGLLVHSRGGARLPLGEPGRGIDLAAVMGDEPARFGDLAAPVIVVQTETDLFRRLGFVRARQPDTDRLRTWEVAGTAHADRFQIGEFEPFLGCAEPVNRGQQAYVVRAALRWLERWARDGDTPPSATPLLVDEAGADLLRDDLGIARGGVRTPAVDAPADVPSGFTTDAASPICALFGSTRSLPRPVWPSPEDYRTAYERATDAAIAAGFVLPEDRDAVLAEAR